MQSGSCGVNAGLRVEIHQIVEEVPALHESTLAWRDELLEFAERVDVSDVAEPHTRRAYADRAAAPDLHRGIPAGLRSDARSLAGCKGY